MRTSLVLLSTILAGCGPTVTLYKFDPELLEPCEQASKLASTTGKDIIQWSEENGEKIVTCRRNHNALVKIIKSTQE